MVKIMNVALCSMITIHGNKIQSTPKRCYFYVKNVRGKVMIRDIIGTVYLVDEKSFNHCFRYI